MRTLLVATDFSTKSKAAIRFAGQVARQAKASLVFFHCLPYLKPTRWTDVQYEAYSNDQIAQTTALLEKIVRDVVRSMGIRRSQFRCVVAQSSDTAKTIIAEARNVQANAVCISTRGGGRLKKLIGTHASAIIHNADIPVFVVPGSYRRNAIRHIVYASDFNNIARELKRVRNVAEALDADITGLHYDYLADVGEVREKLQKLAEKYESDTIEFHIRKYNVDKSLAYHLLRDVKKLKASMLVLFTNQKRGWFDRLFLSSKSVDVAYESSVPLLIMPKE